MSAGTKTNINRKTGRKVGKITAQIGEFDLRISKSEDMASMKKPYGGPVT
jgi:hypothetical protein